MSEHIDDALEARRVDEARIRTLIDRAIRHASEQIGLSNDERWEIRDEATRAVVEFLGERHEPEPVTDYEHGVIESDDLLARLMDTLAYYHCRSTNPKADHPSMGYHAFSEDQREWLREKQREAAEEVLRMWQEERRTFAPQPSESDRSAVPDAATEKLRAERDAALAAIERVRAIHKPVEIEPSSTICGECSFKLPNGKYFGKIVEFPCDTRAALDGAPEPEWEYTFGNVFADDSDGSEGDPWVMDQVFGSVNDALGCINQPGWTWVERDGGSIMRRRKAGPWLPVEGASHELS